jgi:formate hydrogenlyase transcriptional activator
MILSPGPVLTLDAAFGSSVKGSQPTERMDDVERVHVVRVLARCHWRISGKGNAAELLGLNPSTLRSRLKKLGVARPAAFSA